MKAKVKLHHKLSFEAVLKYAMIPLVLLFAVANLLVMHDKLKETANKENTSASVQMYNSVYKNYLAKLPTNQKFTIYRDWKAYVEPRSNWKLKIDWNLMDYSTLAEIDPDILFLEYTNIQYFSDPEKLAKALKIKSMKAKYEFYSDAGAGAIEGYILLYTADFGQVYVSQDLYAKYFSG
jgi:hypothetical protein